jgi:hypothetical protein
MKILQQDIFIRTLNYREATVKLSGGITDEGMIKNV